MTKKWADRLNLLFLVVGVVALPFIKNSSFMQGKPTMGGCSVIIAIMLIIRIIAYFTGYTKEEKQTDKTSVLLLAIICLITIILTFMGI